MAIKINEDFVGWAEEQAELLRTRQIEQLDFEALAEEIAAAGRNERRDFGYQLAQLLSDLLRWSCLPGLRTIGDLMMIRSFRLDLAEQLRESPSLRRLFSDAAWFGVVWAHAQALAGSAAETAGVPAALPDECPWPPEDALTRGWWPGEPVAEGIRRSAEALGVDVAEA